MKNSELIKDYLLKYYDSELLSENNGQCLFAIMLNRSNKLLVLLKALSSITDLQVDKTILNAENSYVFVMKDENNILLWEDNL